MYIRVKNTTLGRILDFIYPRYCMGCGKIGTSFCATCKNYNFKINPPFKIKITDSLFDYLYVSGRREGILSNMVKQYKYNSKRDLSSVLADILSDAIDIRDDSVVVVPLPTIHKHIRLRGFDHMLLIAEALSSLRGWSMERLIIRKNNSVQVGASKEDRIRQADSAYMINENIKIDKNAHYLLIDDVWTTGSSMMAATRVLHEKGATKISCAVILKNS